MELIFLLLAGFFWYSFAQLRGRVQKLEERMGMQKEVNLETSPYDKYITPTTQSVPSQAYTTPEPIMGSTQSQQVPDNISFQPYIPPENTAFDEFVIWLKKDFLMKVGALFLLMGMGWFVSYAFMNNWIGEAGRIMLGLTTGILILVLGAWRIRVYENQGALFTVLGSSTILLTVYAGREMYGFFTPTTALVLMFSSVLFVTFVSLKYQRNSLALAGLILAAVAPYFTASPMPLVMEQFLYLFVVVSGTLWVVYHTGWRNLTLTALIIVFLETLPFAETQGSSLIVLLWVFLFVAIFFIANIISILRVQGSALSQPHLFTALGTASFLIFWVFVVAPDEFQSLLFVAWMIVFSFGTYIVYGATNERVPFYVYGSTSIALLAAATTAELSGSVLTIAYTFEIAAVVITASILRLEASVPRVLSLLFVVPMMFSLGNIASSSWNTGVIHADFFVLLVLMLTLAVVGLFVHENSKTQGIVDQYGIGLILFGVLYGLSLIWLILHALLSDDIATMYTLVVYTVIGLSVFFVGKVQDNKELRFAGGLLLGFVAGRLLLVDVWAMELFGRIVTFLVIGVLFISTAFMRKSSQEKE